MGTQRWLICAFLVIFAILLGVFLYLLYLSGGVKLPQPQNSIELGQNITGMINSRISAFQMSGEYRTVKINGEIKDVYMEGQNTIVELLVSDDEYKASLKVDFGIDEDTVGVSSRTHEGEVRRDVWNNYKVAAIKDNLIKGMNTEVEIVTWISDDMDCAGNESCMSMMSSYRRHKSSNDIFDKNLFQEVQLSDENLMEFNDLDIIGPVITISFLD
jgi:hypothetical protein